MLCGRKYKCKQVIGFRVVVVVGGGGGGGGGGGVSTYIGQHIMYFYDFIVPAEPRRDFFPANYIICFLDCDAMLRMIYLPSENIWCFQEDVSDAMQCGVLCEIHRQLPPPRHFAV